MLVIALLHIVRPGSYLEGQMVILYYSYFSDIALPFGFYFLLCLNESSLPRLKKWFVKSLLVFGAAALAEILQRLGIYALGITFDPFDFVMYGIGAFTAALVERQVFARTLPFWEVEPATSADE
jgi:hypothetical protein